MGRRQGSYSASRHARQIRWPEEDSSPPLRLERVEGRGQMTAPSPKYHESLREVLRRMRNKLTTLWRRMPFVDADASRHDDQRRLGSATPSPVGLPLDYQSDILVIGPLADDNDDDLIAVPRRALDGPPEAFQRRLPRDSDPPPDYRSDTEDSEVYFEHLPRRAPTTSYEGSRGRGPLERPLDVRVPPDELMRRLDELARRQTIMATWRREPV